MTAPNPGRMAYGQLADLLAEQEKRIGKLEQGSRITQLGSASIVDGTLALLDSLGRVKQMIGRQSDGTFAVSYANGDPPPPPAGLSINAGELAYIVGWDGTFIGGRPKPGDFARIDIHEHNTDPDFEPTGATVVGSLFAESAVSIFTGADTVYVKAVAVSLADVPSVPTEAATVTPYPVSRIAAGSIGALELAAEVALLGKIILGLDPSASKIELGSDGLRKLEPDGSVSLSLGAGLGVSNYLSVIDPATGQALASISADGTMTARRFAVSEELTTGGESVKDQIGQKPAGLVAWYAQNSSTSMSFAKKGVAEIRFQAKPGALYRVQTSSILLELGAGRVTGAVGQVGISYTLDGSTPTTGSAEMQIATAPHGATATISKLTQLVAENDTAKTCRLLLTQYPSTGSDGVRLVAAGQSNVQFWVEEVSPPALATTNTGGVNDGAGGATNPATRKTLNWPALWSGSWSSDGTKRSTTGQEIYVGNNGDGNGLHKAALGFDFADIQADLAGATISSVRLYVYAGWWFHNDGGWMVLGLHNSLSATSPAAYPPRSHGPYIITPKYGKPEARWIDLSKALTATQFATVTNALKTGAATGFVIDRTGMQVNADYPETVYAGRINGAGMAKPPELEIIFTTS